jgi:hypothetical protein
VVVFQQASQTLSASRTVAVLDGLVGGRKQDYVSLALMISLGVECRTYSPSARPGDASPNRMNLDRHSSLTERTQRFAKAFRLGLRAGSFNGFHTSSVYHTPKRLSELRVPIM